MLLTWVNRILILPKKIFIYFFFIYLLVIFLHSLILGVRRAVFFFFFEIKGLEIFYYDFEEKINFMLCFGLSDLEFIVLLRGTIYICVVLLLMNFDVIFCWS